MPASIIAKVEGFGEQDGLPGDFDFADHAGILFEWNDEVVESTKPLLVDAALFPDIPVELPGVPLEADQALAPIEADYLPQGHVETAAATNANLLPFDPATAGVASNVEEDISDELDDQNDAYVDVTSFLENAAFYKMLSIFLGNTKS